ncbi:MAG: SURF1 family protein [Alphaproteobacteria bacterium]|nr:SURF1 family protein [Alphaproteobacteria bacterium]NDG04423.1 SURF1 family protein [Alphaproteobacteria bacterium]
MTLFINNIRVKPQFWPTLITTLFVVVLLGLGAWQLERRAWKHHLIAHISDQQAAPEVLLPMSPPADMNAWNYRHATVSGTFLHAHEFHLIGRSLAGAVGYYILTPLQTSSGQIYLINRGFVPTAQKDVSTRAAHNPEGPVTISGILRVYYDKKWFMPDNDADKNVWFFVDHTHMQRRLGTLDAWPNIVLEAAKTQALPLGGQTRLDLPDNHLMYAIFWFVGALACFAIFIISQSSRGGDGDR